MSAHCPGEVRIRSFAPTLLLAIGSALFATHAYGSDLTQQAEILSRIAEYSRRYIASLPSFECVQETRQFEAGLKGRHWSKGDTLTSRLVFDGGQEHSTLQLVNNKPLKFNKRPRTPLQTEGEFGALVARLFTSKEQVDFAWRGWDVIDDAKVAVFDFAIDREHSTLRLSIDKYNTAVVAHRGTIWADPASGAVLRLFNAVDQVPERLETKAVSTIVDFGPTFIGATQYNLPRSASVLLTTPYGRIRNELAFLNYRKFEAESHITFSSERSASLASKTVPP